MAWSNEALTPLDGHPSPKWRGVAESRGEGRDDISDIVLDLKEVLWYFENTSKDNALWYFENSYKSHWGRHLRELQLYLHDKSF